MHFVSDELYRIVRVIILGYECFVGSMVIKFEVVKLPISVGPAMRFRGYVEIVNWFWLP